MKQEAMFTYIHSLIVLLGMLLLSVGYTSAQQCDYVTGPISIITMGGNNTAGYTTNYVLTDVEGKILAINDTPDFNVSVEGFYVVYAINNKNESVLSGLELGGNVNNVTSGCMDISEPYSFTVCRDLEQCNRCLGETIILQVQGDNNLPDFTTKYVLTNTSGVIISIVDEPVFEGLEVGVYLVFAINYETAAGIEGLEIGQNVTDIMSTCKDIGAPYIIGVCDQLVPTIYFDLQGCDITSNAVLVVGELYDSYQWSTGSTNDFIAVSATEPAVYTVTVTLSSGCIGIGRQEITGNEISRIGDFVWNDIVPDGRQGSSEPGLNGVEVRLYADFDRNGVPDIPDFPSCVTTTADHPQTGAPGYYQFTVYQSNYVIEFVSPGGFVPTDSNVGDDAGDSDMDLASGLTETIAIGMNETIDHIDAGFRTSAAICGLVWHDIDADGRRESGETGTDDITVNLYTMEGLLVRTTTTTTDSLGNPGRYCFDDIPVISYYVEVVLPDSTVLSPPNVGTNDGFDSEGTEANGRNTTDIINTTSGMTAEGIDFGYYRGGSICGLVFQEQVPGGTVGVYDAGIDSLIQGSQVFLRDVSTGDTIRIAVTSSDGSYCIEDIPVGSYQVAFGVSRDMNSYVQQNEGDNPLIDSDVNTTTLSTDVIFVGSGDVIQGINAGIRMDALPIEFLYFTGYWDAAREVAVLDWATAVEINNDRFEIERIINLDGAFERIGVVPGAGTTNEVQIYQFIDKDTEQSGNYYYRLKQIDYDGGYDYSKIIAIKVGREKSLEGEKKMVVFPNPVRNQVNIFMYSANETRADITIIDITGKVLYQWDPQILSAGDNVITLKLQDIHTGSYLVKVSTSDQQMIDLIQVAK